MQPILQINLTTGDTSTFEIPKKWESDFLGGASLSARILYTHLHFNLDPYSVESPLLFLTGPLTGTAGPATGRFVVCGRSPATKLWAESNCGGFWGASLRTCGVDGLLITGKAQKPVYLVIYDRRIEIHDAEHLWGRNTYETQSLVRKEINIPGCHVIAIGPAGEKGVSFAGLFVDHGRTAGRTGLGAVAGSKRLKAIAVYGTQKIPIYDPQAYFHLRREANLILKGDNITQVTHELGTSGIVDYADYLGSMPKRYYHQGLLDNVDRVSGSTVAETILTGTKACHACVIACGRSVDLGDGVERKGPEYETTIGFGPNIMNTDLAEIVRLNEICDLYGMDTISASNIIGLAFHLYNLGVLQEKEIGFPLTWGDTKAAAKLLHSMVNGDGIGNIMAAGSKKFAAFYDMEDEAVQVNGLEAAYHDPRGVSGMALVYATSPRGACHNKSDYFFVDWGQAESSLGLEYMDKHAGAEKAKNVVRHQDWRCVCDSLIMCFFGNIPVEMVTRLLAAASGYPYAVDDLLRCGERGWNVKRAINHRLGLSGCNDRLPKVFLQALNEGPAKGYIPPFDEMLGAYYSVRGWDPISGRPMPDKLSSLDLDDIRQDLWM